MTEPEESLSSSQRAFLKAVELLQVGALLAEVGH